VRTLRCITKILQGVPNEAANSHYGQQRVDVTEGKADKKFRETIPIWLALNCFSCYVNRNGQQSNRRTGA